MLVRVLALALVLVGCERSSAQPPIDATVGPLPATLSSAAPPLPRPAGWLKGQLHLHSARSGDSQTEPEVVVRAYSDLGYDFIVFTDHNHVTVMPGTPSMLVLPGVELTQNVAECEPPPDPGMNCLLHVDALLVDSGEQHLYFTPPHPLSRHELFGRAVAGSLDLGGIAQLNHPNFHWAADAELITALAEGGLTHLEIANMSPDVVNEGDADHPSTEAIWDAVLTAGARVYGTATDDAHHYHDAVEAAARGEIVALPDRGWVMVRAKRDPADIRRALEQGDFYASNGVQLERVELGERAIAIDAASELDFELIGDGAVLHRARGRELRFDPAAVRASYLRVRARDASGRHAWTQPLWR